MIAILVISALLVLFILLYAWSSRQFRSTHTQNEALQQQLNKLSSDHRVASQLLTDREVQLTRTSVQLSDKDRELMDLNARVGTAQARNENLTEQLSRQQEELKQLQEKFQVEFENLANRIFDQKSEKFAQQNQTSLDNLLKPLQEKIKDFEKKVEETYQAESRERFGLKKEVERLYDLNQTLSKEASNLTHALKSDSKKQGNWGEMILERILEMSGLTRDIHYLVQETRQDESGNVKRPDIVVLLPGDRQVIIDSKVSLTAYERYCSAEEDSERQAALKAHLGSIRQHVNSLSEKDYPALYRQSPDFVLMFIPLEPAYSIALQQDSGLYDHAFRNHIILVSVFTLLATLRLVESMWRLDSQNRNAKEIVRQGTKLYDKFAGFVQDMKAIGRNIELTQSSFELAMNKLSEGRGNLIRSAERMRLLGLDTQKQLPQEDISDEEEDQL